MSAPAIDHALAYAARGWHVFVLSASKKPLRNCDACSRDHLDAESREACECLTCHGFYAATTDQDRLEEMLHRHPDGCLAIRTGSASGLAVVDVDFREFGPNGMPAPGDAAWQTLSDLDAEELLPGTLMAETGSGGLHLFYAHPGGYVMSGANKYGPGIDSKADGGYVVAAPSVSRSGRYRWTPDGRSDHPLTPLHPRLAERVRPPEPVKAARVGVSPWARPEAVRGRLEALVGTVLAAQPGQRNDFLYWAAKKAGEMVLAGEVDQGTVVAVLTDAGRAIGLSYSEIGEANKGTIGSGLNNAALPHPVAVVA